MSTAAKSAIWAIIPAAGSGQRFGADKPKQYLELQGKSVLAHAISCCTTHPQINSTVVVVAANDAYWPLVQSTVPGKVITALGGAERHRSVYQGLLALQSYAQADDWVLVHDAVRPCLQPAEIDRLIHRLHNHPIGGLLGIRVCDTLKRTDPAGHVLTTLDRTDVWQAQTPQMFRYALLCQALQAAIIKNQPITDEASAIELIGQQPLMVEGCADNIKITYTEDLQRAQHYMQQL